MDNFVVSVVCFIMGFAIYLIGYNKGSRDTLAALDDRESSK